MSPRHIRTPFMDKLVLAIAAGDKLVTRRLIAPKPGKFVRPRDEGPRRPRGPHLGAPPDRRAAPAGHPAANPVTLFFLLSYRFAAFVTRTLIHLCVGFGGASMGHLSAWWGIPIAILSAQTLGRAYLWARRGSYVRALELVADEAEKQARGEK